MMEPRANVILAVFQDATPFTASIPRITNSSRNRSTWSYSRASVSVMCFVGVVLREDDVALEACDEDAVMLLKDEEVGVVGVVADWIVVLINVDGASVVVEMPNIAAGLVVIVTREVEVVVVAAVVCIMVVVIVVVVLVVVAVAVAVVVVVAVVTGKHDPPGSLLYQPHI